ncbi:MAG: GGDEF domain-containing protein [Pseudomonadota bacterium]
MQTKLLESIIVLTAQRDIDALEHTLLSCLGEMFPCVSLALIKPVSEHGPGLVRETLRLWQNKSGGSYYESREGELTLPDEKLLAVITSRRWSEYSNQGGQTVLNFPVIDNEGTLAVVELTGVVQDALLISALQSLGSIYRNYHNLLCENAHDSLTGLLNRKTIDRNFSQLMASQRKCQKVLIEKNQRQKQRSFRDCDQVFLAIADIDHFKRVNDDYGHLYGDEILLLLTKVMKECFRSNDLLFRFGGEEFVVLLEPTDQDQAYVVLEKFRKRVADFNFPRVAHVTVSIGFTAVADFDHLTQVVDRADKALYFAKANGRNATHYYDHLLEKGLLIESEFRGSVELF